MSRNHVFSDQIVPDFTWNIAKFTLLYLEEGLLNYLPWLLGSQVPFIDFLLKMSLCLPAHIRKNHQQKESANIKSWQNQSR